MDGLFKGGMNMYVQKYLRYSIKYLEWLLFSVPQELSIEEIDAIILVLNVKKGGYLVWHLLLFLKTKTLNLLNM